MKTLLIFLFAFSLGASGQPGIFADSSCCPCSKVCAWDTARDIYLGSVNKEPFNGSCRTNYYFHHLRHNDGPVYYAGAIIREYRSGLLYRSFSLDDKERLKQTLYYDKKGEDTRLDTLWDTLGQLNYITRYGRNGREYDRDYEKGKLVTRERGVDRVLSTTPTKYFTRMHEVDWDSAGKRTDNFIYREHTILFPHGRGHDRRGWEVVFRENGKRCLRIRSIDDYVKKICVMPRRDLW